MLKPSIWVWWEAARPKTLGAGLIPVLVGTAASGKFILSRFAGAVGVALLLQIGVNFANDYFDGVKGIDHEQRKGPRRLVAAGLIPPADMRSAMLGTLILAGGVGLLLAQEVGGELILAGAFCLGAALGYSGGAKPYGAAALGEVFVFVFFGVVATVGAAYIQTGELSALPAVASIPVGLLAVVLLMANNLRDIESDEAAGKDTLAVRLGAARTQVAIKGLILCAFLSAGAVAFVDRHPAPMVGLAAFPLARRLQGIFADSDELCPPGTLIAAAKLHAVFGLLLAVGLWLA